MRPATVLTSKVKLRSSTLAFALKFIFYTAVLLGSFELARGTAFERFVVDDCLLQPTLALIRVADRSTEVALIGRSIVSPGSKLNVTRGCEGVDLFLLLMAGLLAFPAGWQAKARGLAAGLVLAYVLSIARLMALHFTLRYAPDAWESMHGLILPLGPVIVMMIYFARWSASASASVPLHAP